MRWLFDVVAIAAWICWQRSREAAVLRLEPASPARRSRTPIGTRRARRTPGAKRGVVAVLVSDRRMELGVDRALGERATVYFADTWTELEELATRVAPTAIFADPRADANANPVGHLARLAHAARVPLIIYTGLTPQVAGTLLNLGHRGIHHVIFQGLDDDPDRLAAVVPWGHDDPPLQAA